VLHGGGGIAAREGYGGIADAKIIAQFGADGSGGKAPCENKHATQSLR
jgi:hypothetical protein